MADRPTQEVELKIEVPRSTREKFKKAAKKERRSLKDFMVLAGEERIARKNVEQRDGVVAYEG